MEYAAGYLQDGLDLNINKLIILFARQKHL
jgi:hypothetical protein